ncbi:uncharacterized protein [Macrobrachium rosenbergii]|uniref:uncharacterized protein n=1 Tax=Macrobrachium rosenbergii TaxID=79674 RepID=UPI0034D6B450
MKRCVSTDHNSGVKKMISLREKVKLRGRKNSSTQTFHEQSAKAKPKSNMKNKGCNAILHTSKQYRGFKEISRPSGSTKQPINTDDDHHHDYASQEQLGDVKHVKHLPSEVSADIDLPFVDTTAIKSLVAGVPRIVYMGRGDFHRVDCIRVCDSTKVTKTFRNISVLQEYLKSEDARRWLSEENGAGSIVPKSEYVVDGTKSNAVEIAGGNGVDAKEPSVKRIKQEVDDSSDIESNSTGIFNVSYSEKFNMYKVVYFSPSNNQFVTKVFGKFSLLLEFLESGEVRGCLLDINDKYKVHSSVVVNDYKIGLTSKYQNNAESMSVESVVSSIKCDPEVSDSKIWSPDLPKASSERKHSSYLSVVKSYLPSDESETSFGDGNEESVDDLEINDYQDNVNIDEEGGDVKPKKEPCFINRKNNCQSAPMDTEGQFPRKRLSLKHDIDTSAIKPLIAGYPKISYRKKFNFYRIVCIRACDGQRVTAPFRSLSKLQSFLNSEAAKSWLLDERNVNVRSKKSKSCPVSYNSELLAVKPEISFIKPDRLRVLCIPKCGRPKTKFFKCSDQGQSDLSAMQKINDFLTGQSFISWITSERRCDNAGKGVDSCWIWKASVKTGPDMRLYLDELLDFDCTKSVDVNPAIAPYLEIHHNPSVPSVSYACNPGWGRAHRSDDTFSLVDGAPHDLFERTYRIVSVYVRCSSRSTMCRTTCGELLSQSRIVGSYFSCCREPVPAHNECSHCKATTSSYNKWHKMNDDSILCRVCYNYLKKKNVPRPLDSKKVHRKPFYVHNQCQYRLRLELTADLQHWQIFYHSANNQDHDTATAVGCKRFTLTERDYIDKVRSSAGRMTAKQIGIAYRYEKKRDSPHPMKQYQSRCKVVDSHIVDNGFVAPVENITISPDWRNAECDDSLELEVDCIEFEINDVEPEVALNTTVPTVVVETKPNLDCNGDIQAKTTFHKKPAKSEECLIVCYKCVMDPGRKDNPFSCRESKELDSHIKMCHRENYFCCSMCFQDNIVESFPSLRILNHHIRQFHNKDRSLKKVQTILQT